MLYFFATICYLTYFFAGDAVPEADDLPEPDSPSSTYEGPVLEE